MSAALDVDAVTVALGGAPVLRGLSLRVDGGTRTALVGPSGAGKTTLLRAIAGLADIGEGTIALGERSLTGVPAHRRGIAVVFQEPRLLPHLSVAENVALPLRARKASRGERHTAAAALLEDVGLSAFAGRRVQGLSGGEQQRVALARALCARPDLLLLDEPLAALDPNRRESLRRLLVRLQAEHGLTMLVVTHDRAEAAELGQRVALMFEGRIVQEDEPRVLFEQPASAAVARFVGAVNLLRGVVRGGRLEVAGARIPVDGGDGPATFTIRPEHVLVDPDGPINARVAEAVYTGAAVRLRVEAADLRLTVVAAPGAAPAAGEFVTLAFPPEHLWRMPGDEAVPTA